MDIIFIDRLYGPWRSFGRWSRRDVEGTGAGGGTGASPTPGGTGASPTPSPTPSPATSTPTPAPPADPGQGVKAQGQPEVEDGNWKQLRTRYDERGQQISQMETQVQTFNAIQTAASTTATRLGYSPEDFTAAFSKDPAATISILRQEAAEADQREGVNTKPDQNQQDMESMMDKRLDQRLKPINDHVNAQVTEAAMARYTTEVNTVLSADPIISSAPPEVRGLVQDYLSEYFAGQPKILEGFKTQGNYAPVKDTAQFVIGRLHDAFTKWTAHQQSGHGRTGSPSPTPATPGTRTRPSLDQIIEDPGVLGDQYRQS